MATKWQLHRLYLRHPRIRGHLPATARLTPASLGSYLRKYRTVYVKGSNQHMGQGVVKAWRANEGYRYIRVRGGARQAPDVNRLYRQLRAANPKQVLLVQQGIDLARLNGSPYDIRVMLMRDGAGGWQYAGMLAKVAGKGSVISNVRRGGGYATTVDAALARSLGYKSARIAAVKRQLVSMSFDIVRYALANGFHSHEAGIDMAIDQRGKVWLIEANLVWPSHALFNRLADKTSYRRVVRLAAAYRSRLRRLRGRQSGSKKRSK